MRLNKSTINYDFIKHHAQYGFDGEVIGECDLWARYISPITWKSYDLFFEVRLGDKQLYKACLQLKKDKIYLSKCGVDVVHKFFVNQNKILRIKY